MILDEAVQILTKAGLLCQGWTTPEGFDNILGGLTLLTTPGGIGVYQQSFGIVQYGRVGYAARICCGYNEVTAEGLSDLATSVEMVLAAYREQGCL